MLEYPHGYKTGVPAPRPQLQPSSPSLRPSLSPGPSCPVQEQKFETKNYLGLDGKTRNRAPARRARISPNHHSLCTGFSVGHARTSEHHRSPCTRPSGGRARTGTCHRSPCTRSSAGRARTGTCHRSPCTRFTQYKKSTKGQKKNFEQPHHVPPMSQFFSSGMRGMAPTGA